MRQRKNTIFSIALCAIVMIAVLYMMRHHTCESFEVDSDYIYNGFSSEWVVDNDKYIFTKTAEPRIIDKMTGKSIDFYLDPFEKRRTMPLTCVNECTFFIVYEESENENGYEVAYYENDFDRETLLKENLYSYQSEYLFGLIRRPNQNSAELYSSVAPTQCVIAGSKIYFYEFKRIVEYDLIFRKKKVIYEGELGNSSFSYYDRRIYFQTSDFRLLTYDIDQSKIDAIKGIHPYNFVVSKYGIIYNDLEQENHLYYFKFEDGHKKCIAETSFGGYDVEEENLYYVTKKGDYYRYNILSGERIRIAEGQPSQIIKKIKGRNEIYIAIDGIEGISLEQITW